MIDSVVQFGNIILCVFVSFDEFHFRPRFDARALRRCIAIVKSNTSRLFGYNAGDLAGPGPLKSACAYVSACGVNSKMYLLS